MHEFFGSGVFQEETAGARHQRLDHVLVVAKRGEDEHPCLSDLPGCLDPVQAWHSDVHEHHVRARTLDPLEGGQAVGGFAHDFDAGLA